jgi:sugar O-acyltransferase (sialic acid O-acetyltransferase NeuD family)
MVNQMVREIPTSNGLSKTRSNPAAVRSTSERAEVDWSKAPCFKNLFGRTTGITMTQKQHFGDRSGTVVIIGGGGFGREVIDVVQAINDDGGTIELVGVIDDGLVETGLLDSLHVPLLGTTEVLQRIQARYVIAISSASARREINQRATDAGLVAATLIHPSATVGSLSSMEPGVVICSQASLTSNIHLGRHVHINPQTAIGHDVVVHDYTTILPAAVISGKVVLGEGATVGAGAVVIQGLTIGRDAMIGAGAVVTRDVEDSKTVKGVPARAK